jgi:hypothetical protein
MVDGFFRKMKDVITGDDQQQDPDYYEQARPASEDPYGDPADQEYYS